MRVLHVVEAVEGGVGVHLRHLLAHQVASGDEVGLALPRVRSWGSTDTHVAGELGAIGVRMFELPMRRLPIHPVNVLAAVRLRRVFRRWRPDLVHTHATIAGAVARPVAWSVRIPTVHTQHGARFSDPNGGASARVGRALERMLRPFTSAAIAVSPSEADALRRVHSERTVVVVPNGIAVRALDDPRSNGRDGTTVVSVGRFAYPKDPRTAVRVLAETRRRLPGTHALVIGYGEEADEIRALARSLDPGIEIRDDIPGPEAIARATVVVLCSHAEGLPYAVLEAMERGVPVVANDVVGCRDLIDASTGALFPVGDVEAGADAVTRILADPALAASLGAAGRARVERDHSVDTMARLTAGAYDLARR